MLKVVGASWVKTRISSYILGGTLLLAVGSLFIVTMDGPDQSDTYCATVFWTKQYGFSVEYWGQQNNLTQVQKGVARTCYQDTTLKNGWSQIEIETQGEYPDWVQAYGAGMLEGALTWANIHKQWKNTIESYCDADEPSKRFCEWLRITIVDNYENILVHSESRGKLDHYWYQIWLFLQQVQGLEFGWGEGASRGRFEEDLELSDFLLMNAAADLPDFRVYFENFVQKQPEGMEYLTTPVKASMVVKYLNEMDEQGEMVPKKVLIGHSSDGYYSSMLRMLKKYKFHYHYTGTHKSHQVAGVDIAFTGYPGSLASSDDFYTITGRKSKFVVGGIRIQNKNIDLWQLVDVKESVLLAARVMAANRLAHSGYGWSRVMSMNPGFGAKQWMVIDVRRMHNHTALEEAGVLLEKTVTMSGFSNGAVTLIKDIASTVGNERDGAVWVVDQLPGRLHAEDVTEEVVYKTSFWTGNGIPFFSETREASRIDADDSLKISNQIVGHINVTDLKSIETVLRSRAYRGDLISEKPSAFGNIDLKLYSETSSASMEFHAIAGPLFYRIANDQLPSTTEATGETTSESSHLAANLNGLQPNDLINMDNAKEIDVYTERRSVRDDIKATAMLKRNGPFRWSSASADLQDVNHNGHPDVWNFGAVSPRWAWTHESDDDHHSAQQKML